MTPIQQKKLDGMTMDLEEEIFGIIMKVCTGKGLANTSSMDQEDQCQNIVKAMV